jgi:antitoxin VapB
MMAILIKDQEADQLIRTLAERTGESITDAVKQAVRERLERVPLSKDEIAARKRKLAELIAKCNAMPTVDDRTPDEIIGYNELGHFD